MTTYGLASTPLNLARRPCYWILRDAPWLPPPERALTAFFGCITRGVHDFDPADRMLVAGETFEDLREQHLDLTSEPHIRAAVAEKWSRCTELPTNCVWVSAEVVDLSALPAHGQFC